MTDVKQETNAVDFITILTGTDRLLVNTDVVNNVLEQIEKDDFVADIISTDSGNLLDVGTDNKLAVIDSTITLEGNTFNGNSQLIKTTAGGLYPALDGSLITNVSATIDKTVTQLGTCATASATAAKEVTLSGFSIDSGISGQTIQVTFTNANTTTTPTLNVNSTGAKAIYNEVGTAVSATNPAYFPAGSTIEFTYNGTNWVFKNRVVNGYINGSTTYTVWANGKKTMAGQLSSVPNATNTTITFPISFSNICNYLNYSVSNDNAAANTNNIVVSINTTSAVIKHYMGVTVTKLYWQAEGY